MQKQITQFKSVVQGIENLFHFESGCSVDIAKQALFDCMKWIGQIEDMQKSQIASAQTDSEKKTEDTPKVENITEAKNDQSAA